LRPAGFEEAAGRLCFLSSFLIVGARFSLPLLPAPLNGYNFGEQGAVLMDDSSQSAEKPVRRKLRWYQYRLRSLCLLTLVVAIGMSYVAVKMRDGRRQKAAAEAILKTGGTVESETTWLGRILRDESLVSVTLADFLDGSVDDTGLAYLEGLSQLRYLGLDNTQVTDTGLVHLQGLSQLQELHLDYTKVTDAGLVNLQRLTQLRELSLNYTQVSDAGLVHLQGLSQLQHLSLDNTHVTDDGLAHLQGLGQLQALGLENTQVTDEGLAHLQAIKQLYWLNLNYTQVTDAGLVHLQSLKQLHWLYLKDTKVTDQAVTTLNQAIPHCNIECKYER
jgi:hypothetical protein